jgi:hypothetical protein
MPTDADLVVAPYTPALEAGIVRVLNSAFPNGWGTDALWRWKHRDRPGFVDRDVLAARAGDEVVGCFHSGILPLTIDEGLALPVCFDGDLAITREFRGRGIPVDVRDASERRLFEERVPIRGGFTSLELNARLYEPYFDFIFVPTVTTEFRKVLGVGPLQPRVERLGETLLARPRLRGALARRPLVVDLEVDGIGPCHLALTGARFALNRGPAGRPDLAVRLPYAVVASLADGVSALARTLLREAARGRVRVTGLVAAGPRLLALLASLARGR